MPMLTTNTAVQEVLEPATLLPALNPSSHKVHSEVSVLPQPTQVHKVSTLVQVDFQETLDSPAVNPTTSPTVKSFRSHIAAASSENFD